MLTRNAQIFLLIVLDVIVVRNSHMFYWISKSNNSLLLQLAKMCVPAGLLAITTAIVLYANSTVTKRAQIFYVHTSLFSSGTNHSFNVNLNLLFFSTSFKTDFQFQEDNTFSPCSLLNF